MHRYGKHLIHPNSPHPQSWASLLLLIKGYKRGAGSDGFTWKKYRKWFFRQHVKQHGKLICHYCGKKGLMHDAKVHTKEEYKKLATVDHVVPLSKGGERYKSSNLVVSCWTCNQRKGDKDPQVVQLVEHSSDKGEVGGSTPPLRTKPYIHCWEYTF